MLWERTGSQPQERRCSHHTRHDIPAERKHSTSDRRVPPSPRLRQRTRACEWAVAVCHHGQCQDKLCIETSRSAMPARFVWCLWNGQFRWRQAGSNCYWTRARRPLRHVWLHRRESIRAADWGRHDCWSRRFAAQRIRRKRVVVTERDGSSTSDSTRLYTSHAAYLSSCKESIFLAIVSYWNKDYNKCVTKYVPSANARSILLALFLTIIAQYNTTAHQLCSK